MLTLHPVYTRHKHKHKKMETIPFSYAYAYAYVTPGLHGLSYAYVYACAYAYVVRVNQALSSLFTLGRKILYTSDSFAKRLACQKSAPTSREHVRPQSSSCSVNSPYRHEPRLSQCCQTFQWQRIHSPEIRIKR